MATAAEDAAISSGSSARGPRLQTPGESKGFDTAFSERVRLYLKVTFLINVFFCLVSIVLWLTRIDGDIEGLDGSLILVMMVVTALNGGAWALVARARLSFIGTIVVVATTTFFLSASYTHISMSSKGSPHPSVPALFSLVIVSIVLVLRASLVPSPVEATAIAGILSMICPLYVAQPRVIGAGWEFFVWMVVLALVVVAVTMVTSRTVYGLERRMIAEKQLGQYQLQKLVGRGAMGEVYLAKHALLRRPAAVKLLRDASAASARERFRQEVQTASGLSHPNTIEIYDYGRTPDGIFYFAMEYVEGATLEDIITATGPMPPGRVIHLLRQAAGSLREAHQRGLVHRDLKPSNLMLCERGGVFDTVKVLDFGLVRDLGESNEEESSGLLGTPMYLAPEAILDSGGFVQQSDVYAFGATAYFLLTARPPFTSGSLVEILSDHLATEPIAPDCKDKVLVDLVMQCLRKNPDERPADAVALVAALDACASNGLWEAREADIWWAEHREVITARKAHA